MKPVKRMAPMKPMDSGPRPSVLDGKPTPTKGMRELAAEALGRLGIETVPIRMERDYA
jgi:hypothetical protein